MGVIYTNKMTVTADDLMGGITGLLLQLTQADICQGQGYFQQGRAPRKNALEAVTQSTSVDYAVASSSPSVCSFSFPLKITH